MIVDFRRADRKEIDSDLCIIGAGAAGITLARAFAGSDVRVCLLESGGFEFSSDIQDLYAGADLGFRELYGLAGSRLRYFGGTTNHWTGRCGPLEPLDFEPRPWVAHSGWPIRFDELRDYYEAAQSVCEVGRFRYRLGDYPERARAAPAFDSVKLVARVWQFSPPTRFGERYREELQRAGNVHVYLHANVTELETSHDAARVTAARLRTLDGHTGRARAKVFVLACGGIENARLLLLSNRVASRGLGNAHDVVGRYYMDHPKAEGTAVAVVTPGVAIDAITGTFHSDGVRFETMVCASEELQRRAQTLNWAAQFSFLPETGEWADAARGLRDAWQRGQWPDDFGKKVWAVISDLDEVVAGAYRRATARPLGILARLESPPDPNNRITLATERDALGQNRVERLWRLGSQERHTARVAMQAIGEEFGRLGLGRVRLADWLTGDDHTWPDSLHGGPHPMGTTRMASDPRKGVTDATCRVHGVGNLFVAGSSVFPTGGYAHPTLTIVALALRLADHLKRQLKRA